MDDSLLDVYRRGLITKETALKYAINPDMLERKL
jgi:twitching motility protein PilT